MIKVLESYESNEPGGLDSSFFEIASGENKVVLVTFHGDRAEKSRERLEKDGFEEFHRNGGTIFMKKYIEPDKGAGI